MVLPTLASPTLVLLTSILPARDREAVPGSEKRLFSTQFGKSPTPVGILVSADGKRAWVASTNADVVSEIDLQKIEVVRRLTAGKEPDGLGGAFRAAPR